MLTVRELRNTDYIRDRLLNDAKDPHGWMLLNERKVSELPHPILWFET